MKRNKQLITWLVIILLVIIIFSLRFCHRRNQAATKPLTPAVQPAATTQPQLSQGQSQTQAKQQPALVAPVVAPEGANQQQMAASVIDKVTKPKAKKVALQQRRHYRHHQPKLFSTTPATTNSVYPFTGWVTTVHGVRQHPVIDIGIDSVWNQSHSFATEASTLGGNTLFDAKNRIGISPKIHLGLGYLFYNGTWLHKLFGHTNTVMLKLGYLDASTQDGRNNLRGYIWRMDGTGDIDDTLLPVLRTIYQDKLIFDHRVIDGGLFLHGQRQLRSPRWILYPSAGVVYNNIYDYTLGNLRFNDGGDPQTVTDRYKVNTSYFGVSAGGKLAFAVTHHWVTFGSAELQLLHVYSSLNARQTAFEVPPTGPVRTTTASDNMSRALSYRVVGAVGIGYKFTALPHALAVNLLGGVDYWAFSPRAVAQTRTTAAHLTNGSRADLFVRLQLHMPLGAS